MAANLWTMSLFMANNGSALQRLQSAGVNVFEFPDTVWDAFGQAAQEVIQEPMGDEFYKRTLRERPGVAGEVCGLDPPLAGGLHRAARPRPEHLRSGPDGRPHRGGGLDAGRAGRGPAIRVRVR